MYDIIIVDVREYLNGGDKHDYKQILYGPTAIPDTDRLSWEQKPISGLFEDIKNFQIRVPDYIPQLQVFML